MKKSVIILGVALVAFANVSMAAGHMNPKFEILNSSAGPLHVAISKGDVEIVRKFIAYGANVNEQSEDMTPLMIAARYNKVEIMKILLENGARPNDKNEKGYTALKYAEISNATDAIAILKSLK
ncbi:ankyrin repeat domain-containing protein [Flavobacterium sp. LC2016-12]|uniref:ankyrin repeat domain-containing protein n=1 Tax=Flavobacterium sp. LC2016-12 TaxID=2783794 RepID=UPI00188D41DF|nr:ankyrin repeat domain-containing protein [Flavobacterium sp. LC2016-12]MBF4464936.1 ankyrin repeat domain-containing protein [Flavobacterium sp. LC2016-12]